MSKITTFIPGSQTRSTVIGGFGPADGSEGYFEWDPSKYDNVTEVYAEIVASADGTGCVPNGTPGVDWELYDVTNSTQIGQWRSLGTGWVVRRGTDISGSMPANMATMRISWKTACGTSATASATRLIIVQENPTKTRSFISVGGYANTNSTSYTTLGADDKQWQWAGHKFGTAAQVHIHSTFKSNTSGRTATVKVDNLGETDAVGQMANSTTNYALQKANNVSGSMTNAETYRTYYKISDSAARAYIANCYIVTDLIDLSRFVTNLDIMCEGFFDSASSYSEEAPFLAVFDASTDFWDGVTKSIYHQACLYRSSATSAGAILFDDASQIATSEVTSTSSTMEIQKSSALAEPADASVIGYSLKQTGGGRGAVARSSYSVITFEIGAIESAGTNMQVNIGDEWKTVEGVQVNIGDAWKTVNGVQINIGDSWETVF